tara:strand:- start:580 stop:867 length:288 start_codon:yes stop_codon:yes gene_type:complete
MEGNIQGNTPFERAMIGRHKGQLMLVTHLAVKELVEQLDECDRMIAQWETEKLHFGSNSEETLMLATQALKDKKLFEAALIEITKSSAQDLGLEA